MNNLVIGVFAAICVLIDWMLIRHQTKKMITHFQGTIRRVIDEMNQEAQQFMEEISAVKKDS